MKGVVWALLAFALPACTDQSTAVREQTRDVLPTLSLSVGQRAIVQPGWWWLVMFDSLPELSSSAVAFFGMSRDTFYSSVGAKVPVQRFEFLATAPGRTVVTLRSAGPRVVQDTINVQATLPHGAFAQVSVGLSLNTCAATTHGGGFCWGTLYTTQVDSVEAYAKPVYAVPGTVPGGLAWLAFSGGFNHNCGLTTDGAAYCWGYNSNGQLGNNSGVGSSLAYTPAPVAVSGGLTFKAVSAGAYHTCGLTTSGAIYCWGLDSRGELGDGTTSFVNSAPVAVSGGLTFVAVTVSDDHSCGLAAAGAAYCWGDNAAGALGTGDTIPSTVPVPVTGGLKFVALSAGFAHGCGLTQAGGAYCWGNNGAGELGNGTTVRSTSPVLVSGGLTFTSISAGQDYTCGVTTGGLAYCWGDNSYGTLGNNANLFTHNANPTPLPVSGGLIFQAVSAGYLHTCGVTTAGAVYCWGDNSEGELGNGSNTLGSVSPVLVSGP